MTRTKKRAPKTSKNRPKKIEEEDITTTCEDYHPTEMTFEMGLQQWREGSIEFVQNSVDKLFDQRDEVRNRMNANPNSSTMGTDVAEEEKGPFYYEVISLLQPFMDDIHSTPHQEKPLEFDACLELVRDRIKKHFEINPEKNDLMELMGVDRFVMAAIRLELDIDVVQTYNKMSEDDPAFFAFTLHPRVDEIRRFGIFLDRYDTVKEVICTFVFTTLDKRILWLPQINCNPYPTCWTCRKQFGTMCCQRCRVAKYCSKDCQVTQWKSSHHKSCPGMVEAVSQHVELLFP
ncbi:hypothetical protein PROFUN_06122 [Planoprotostelium fungivorum]|uniref:MYND-type domain-containing protein n=1 Tax=Planoprotostelium fungivorum TaxID=1890364 RepID=A0A2P6NPM5_9EUKA|nr:hypothetical protein PROFUN_06122 [Planoprotostelium fungivorum]